MPQDVAPPLVNALLKEFPADQSYAPSDFKRGPMPAPVVHFLERRLQSVVRDRQQELELDEFSWVDVQQPEVREAQRAFSDSIERYAQFPKFAWEKELTQAVHRTMHYLIRPVPTAVGFIYVNEEPYSLPPRQVLDRLAYFSPYSYLREAARAYIQQRDLETVDRTRLTTLLTRVDQQMTEDYSPEQWEALLEPLFSMASVAFGDHAVPSHELEQFFRDKDQPGPVRQLRSMSGRVDRNQLRTLFRQDEQPTVEQSKRPQPSRQPSSPPKRSERSPSAQRSDEAVPLWKQFQEGSAPSTATAVTKRKDEEDQEARPRWADFQPEPRESPKTAPLEKLERSVFGGNGAANRNRYIRELFGGSEEEYRKVLGTLRDTDTWNEASQVIARDVFRKHQVNIYSDPAVSFTDSVEAGYE